MDTNNKDNSISLPVAVVIAGFLIAGAVVWNGSRPSTPSTGSGQAGTVAPVVLTAEAKAVVADVKANTNTYQTMIDADKTEAGKIGVNATPAFLIGKQIIAGADPYTIFQTVIADVTAGRPATTDPKYGMTVSKIDSKNVAIANDPIIGQSNAPITIVFWSDYQCPFCKRFELETLPQIMKDYVDTGKAKIVIMDFPFLGNDSITAGEYGRAIWKLYPDQYFAWRTAMYVAQDQEQDIGFGDADSIDQLDSKTLK